MLGRRSTYWNRSVCRPGPARTGCHVQGYLPKKNGKRKPCLHHATESMLGMDIPTPLDAADSNVRVFTGARVRYMRRMGRRLWLIAPTRQHLNQTLGQSV